MVSDNPNNKVAIIMGSSSDKEIMQACADYLDYFEVVYEIHVMSAHRDPDKVIQFTENAERNGFSILIAGAGMAAHLPGVIASRTTLPVIGVPLAGSALGGQDALYSIVQMPAGIPVATVAIGKAGARNAAILAVEILALNDPTLKERLTTFRKAGSKI
jgi:5-(carboxyamino)imidazole ribonucleotide mutase